MIAMRSLACVLLGLGIGALAATRAQAETIVERGAYLMNSIVACGNCHTPKAADGKAIANMELAGGVVINAPIFRAVAPNITPDIETGIGDWTEAQIIRAIREGKRADGTVIGPPMPIAFYRQMSDNDARALAAYLRTVKPIKNKTEKSTYKIPLPPNYGPLLIQVPDVPRADRRAYGEYLANGLGHCMDCHTPLLPDGRNDMTKVGAGGREIETFTGSMVTTSNLTPANAAGISHWTDAQVRTAITAGMRPDRPLVRLMAFDWYKNLRANDLDALVAYLRGLKPATP